MSHVGPVYKSHDDKLVTHNFRIIREIEREREREREREMSFLNVHSLLLFLVQFLSSELLLLLRSV